MDRMNPDAGHIPGPASSLDESAAPPAGLKRYTDRNDPQGKSHEAELVRDGIAAAEISIHGYGESNPLVPTAKGVREPQNRRVEVILR